MDKKTGIAIVFVLITTMIWSSIGGYFAAQFINNPYIEPLKPKDPDRIIEKVYPEELNQKYMYDRIVLSGKDSEGNVFFTKLQLTRKQIGYEEFQQSYAGYFEYVDDKDEYLKRIKWANGVSKNREAEANGFLEKFKIINEEDRSTRKEIEFRTNFDGEIANIVISDLTGDFIVKDAPDYTRFISTGIADVEINGEVFSVNAMSDRIISDDYSKSIFWDTRDELEHTTHSIMLWDDVGNFYLIDKTDVNSAPKNTPYAPHEWVIHKDIDGGYTQKAFDFDMNFELTEDKLPASWLIEIPDIKDSYINLEVDNFLDSEKNKGRVSGTIIDSQGQREISGHFVYLDV